MNAVFQPPVRTIEELLHRLGDVPAGRVRFSPVPGTAALDDLLRPENEGCELVDGTLVEKPVGIRESILACWLIRLLHEFVESRNLGVVTGEQGYVELTGGAVRGPDVAYFSWDRLQGRRMPTDPIPRISPNLAVEILSVSNTPREMQRKYQEYFDADVQLVWEINPRVQTVRIYTALDQFRDLSLADTLTGDPVLPGFTLPLTQLFVELDRHG